MFDLSWLILNRESNFISLSLHQDHTSKCTGKAICCNFSRMRNQGSRFTLCSPDIVQPFAIRNRPQPFTTVCNRSLHKCPCEVRMAIPLVAASSGDKAQSAWQAWHFATWDENWRKLFTKHSFGGPRFCGSLGKLVGKHRFCSYNMLENWGRLARNFQHVSSRFFGFLLVSQCLATYV